MADSKQESKVAEKKGPCKWSPHSEDAEAVHCVEEHLLISGFYPAKCESELQLRNVRAIVDLTMPNEVRPANFEKELGVEYCLVPIGDTPDFSVLELLPRALPFIDKHIGAQQTVLVHCTMGVSRSASIVLAFLVKHRKMTLLQAYKHLRSCRRVVSPNPGFLKQLVQFEQEVHGKASIDVTENAKWPTVD